MRVLFFMRHPGYVRNFESALAELARRGHDVHVAFDSLNTKWMAGADPLGGLSGNERVTFDRAPRVRTGWQHLATAVRSCDDFLRYQRPEYANAPKLRKRAEERLPRGLRSLMTSSHGPRLQSALRALDRSMRLDPQIARYVRDAEPDIVLVTPLVGLGSTQADYLKAAHALGVPAGLCVASWDNLTNKGLIREHPELVAVWNDAQRREAVELHGTPEANVAVTGAHSYDHWFSWEPSSDRETFCARVGLDPERPYILYLGSSPFIAPQEHRHVTAWLRGLRDRPEPELQEVGVLIRPHPQNGEQWAGADLSEIGNVTVYPPSGADPVDRRRKVEYYDSIHHAALVVGVNTSAQIESAIVGRSVFCLLSEEFSDTQQGTLHFEHLAADDGGLLVLADNFDEHAGQLAAALRDPGRDDERRRRFLANFVRPFGLDAAGAPRLATAIELAAAREPQASPAGNRVLTALLAPVAFAYPGGKHSPFDVKAQVGARTAALDQARCISAVEDRRQPAARRRASGRRARASGSRRARPAGPDPLLPELRRLPALLRRRHPRARRARPHGHARPRSPGQAGRGAAGAGEHARHRPRGRHHAAPRRPAGPAGAGTARHAGLRALPAPALRRRPVSAQPPAKGAGPRAAAGPARPPGVRAPVGRRRPRARPARERAGRSRATRRSRRSSPASTPTSSSSARSSRRPRRRRTSSRAPSASASRPPSASRAGTTSRRRA